MHTPWGQWSWEVRQAGLQLSDPHGLQQLRAKMVYTIYRPAGYVYVRRLREAGLEMQMLRAGLN